MRREGVTGGGTDLGSPALCPVNHLSSAATLQRQLLELLDTGCVPWRHSQPCLAMGQRHRNLIHGRPYGGADALVLGAALVSHRAPLPLWCTYGEARAVGLQARRGCKGVRLGLANGDLPTPHRQTCVFNVADLVGRPLQPLLARRRRAFQAMALPQHQVLSRAALHFQSWPVTVQFGAALPAYDPGEDIIRLPSRQRFTCGETFLGTWARLQILSTGHPSRLNRQDRAPVEGQEKARGEFLCELAWSLLADRMGLAREYGVFVLAEADWIALLRASAETFFELLAEASKAVDQLAPQDDWKGIC